MKHQLLLASCAAMALSACGGKKVDVNMNFVSSALSLLQAQKAVNNLNFMNLSITPQATVEVGLGSTGLTSYKVYFREIKICETVEDQGSGYTNPSGCSTIYENTTDTYNGTETPTAADFDRFLAAGTGKFYDLLSETDLASLNRAASVSAGDYNYGLMEVHPWVKITAKSGTLCTRNAGMALVAGSSQFNTYVQTDTLLCSAGDAQEVLAYMVNGNSNFKFAKTFTVAEETAVTLDLAFNLANNLRAVDGGSGLASGVVGNSGANAFQVPMLNVGPVPRASTDTNKVETYLFTPGGGDAGKFSMRVELFYNASDTTKAPLAVNYAILSGTATASATVKGSSDLKVTGDQVEFQNYLGTTYFTFTRTASGASATGTLVCGGESDGSAFPYGGSSGICTVGNVAMTDSTGPALTDLN